MKKVFFYHLFQSSSYTVGMFQHLKAESQRGSVTLPRVYTS